MNSITLKSRAKINLSIDVLGKRWISFSRNDNANN